MSSTSSASAPADTSSAVTTTSTLDLASHPNNKPCTICSTPRPVLVRCQIDDSGVWNFVCPGKCWKSVSGGVEDAKGLERDFPHYRYGGMWKNKHAYVSAKKKTPKKAAGPSTSVPTPSSTGREESSDSPSMVEKQTSGNIDSLRAHHTDAQEHLDLETTSTPAEWLPNTHYPRAVLVTHGSTIYICRREHTSRPLGGKEGSGPAEKKGYRFWKVDDEVMRGLTAEESE